MARSSRSRDRGSHSARGGRKRPAKSAAKARPAERPLAFEPVTEEEAEAAGTPPGGSSPGMGAAVSAEEAALRPVRRRARARGKSAEPAERRYLVRELFD